jgi:lipopolysaccharide export system permease protein
MFATSSLGRYLFTRVLGSLITMMAAIMLTIILIDVVEQFRNAGNAALSLPQALFLTGLKVPLLFEQMAPFAMLAGGMSAYINLNRKSELSAIRASGVSAWRFLTPVILVGVVLGIFLSLAVNPVGAKFNNDYEATRDAAAGVRRAPSSGDGLWFLQGEQGTQTVIHAARALEGGTRLADVSFFQFEIDDRGQSRFSRRIDAEEARLTTGFWQLSGVVENVVPDLAAQSAATAEGVPAAPLTQRSANLALPTTLEPRDLLERVASPNTLGFWQLPAFIAQAKGAGLQPSRHEFRWFSLLALPLTLAAMGLIGALFSLRLARSGGLPQMIALGVLTGFFFYFATRLSEAMATSALSPPLVAAFAPALAALFAASAAIAVFEDG